MFDTTTEDELAELVAFSQIEFVGDERLDWGFARLIATIRNMMRGAGDDPVTPDRFMPFWDQAELHKQDEARLAAKVRSGLRAALSAPKPEQ